MPLHATKYAAAHDLYLPVDIRLRPGEITRVGLNLCCAMPSNFYCNVHIRSGVGFKYGVILSNGTGIVDSDYYNEWFLSLYMLPQEHIDDPDERLYDFYEETCYKFSAGERIAQAVFSVKPDYETSDMFFEAEEIQKIVTQRGSDRHGGLGHTGK